MAGSKTVVKVVGAQITLRTNADHAMIAGRLEDLGLAAKDMRGAFDQYGEYIVNKHIPNQFKRQGTPKRWAPLSEKYAQWKRKHYGNLPILVLSGKMRKGFKWQVTPRTMKIVNRVAAGQGGNKTPRWLWHQEGTDNMPARPMLQIGRKDRDMLIKYAHAHLRAAEGIGL